MGLNESELKTLKDLEESLWRSEIRFDLSHQEKVFAPDFFEFGRSGRTYAREQMILTTSEPIAARMATTISSRNSC